MKKIDKIISIDISFNEIPEEVITNILIRATKRENFENLRV